MKRPARLPDCGFPPSTPPDFYAMSITAADVAAMEAFFTARLDEVGARYQPTAPETRIAQALYETVGYQLDLLHDSLGDTRPEALIDRLDLWNSLVYTLEPWRGTPGHDGERWCLITWTDETAPVRARRRAAQRQGAQ
ncbi:hypothetical protein ACWGN5_38000 [Streptomyces sp. NPDC055815]